MRFAIISLISFFVFVINSPSNSAEFYTPNKCATKIQVTYWLEAVLIVRPAVAKAY